VGALLVGVEGQQQVEDFVLVVLLRVVSLRLNFSFPYAAAMVFRHGCLFGIEL
jgi:hypothetical protein